MASMCELQKFVLTNQKKRAKCNFSKLARNLKAFCSLKNKSQELSEQLPFEETELAFRPK
jgi:hypothetical protein